MFNLFRMDLRRLIHSKSFYIVLCVTVALILAVILLAATMSDSEFLDEMQSNGAEISEYDRQEGAAIRNMSQLDFMNESLNSGFLLVMIGIGMTLFVHSDFSSGYIKNICFARSHRRDYVLSKALLAGAYSGIFVIVGALISLAGPPLFGLHPAPDAALDILQYAFWLWLPTWAFGLMGLALVLLTRSSTLGIVLAVLSGSGMVAAILQYYRSQFDVPPLERYLLSKVVGEQCIPWLGTGQMAMILACTAGWALLYGAVSLITMEKRDI